MQSEAQSVQLIPMAFCTANGLQTNEIYRKINGNELAIVSFVYQSTVSQAEIPKPIVNHTEKWMLHMLAKELRPKVSDIVWTGYRMSDFSFEPIVAHWKTDEYKVSWSSNDGRQALVLNDISKGSKLSSSDETIGFIRNGIVAWLSWPKDREVEIKALRMKSSEDQPIWFGTVNLIDPMTTKTYDGIPDLGRGNRWMLHFSFMTDGRCTMLCLGAPRIQMNGFAVDPKTKVRSRSKSRFDLKDDDFKSDYGVD